MVYTSPTKKACIIEWDGQGIHCYEIAHKFGIHWTTVNQIIKHYQKHHNFYHVSPKKGRPCKMDIREAQVACRMIAQTEAANATELQKKAFPDVATRTIQRRLRDQGLLCRIRRSKPYLSKVHKEWRRKWALEHADWTVEDWHCIIFSDESKFQLFKSDGHQYCYIKPGQALSARFTKKTVKHGGGSIMVWGCITGQGMGQLHRIEGIMCGLDYVQILDKHYLGTLKKLKLKHTGKSRVIFQQDNDPKHKSKVAEAWFQKKHVKQLPWPASSPDMSPIEHVWDQIDDLVRTRNPLPQNVNELWRAIQEEWDNYPKAALDKLYKSMPHRVNALLKARGGHTKY
ncbi:hypothetical protein M0805_008112 [Coniferiporia weirii]|nr:hypothetical protein M0805_008112 [Coniferiporia weirii]